METMYPAISSTPKKENFLSHLTLEDNPRPAGEESLLSERGSSLGERFPLRWEDGRRDHPDLDCVHLSLLPDCVYNVTRCLPTNTRLHPQPVSQSKPSLKLGSSGICLQQCEK